jgi:N-carbamoylputrescine amidase
VLAALLNGGDWREGIRAAACAGADVICLPQLSFGPYLPATRDRAGLELAERAPAATLDDAVDVAAGAWVAASAYESEGEGVFYLTAALGRVGEPMLRQRQHALDAIPGRYEPMFFSPGHGDRGQTIALPWGPTAVLVGADLRDPEGWASVARAGAAVVVAGASEPNELWRRTCAVVAGAAAAHGIIALVANRGGEESGITYAGGALAVGADGQTLRIDDGIVEVR